MLRTTLSLAFVFCSAACGEDLGASSAGALAGQCESCHPEHAEAHRASRHAKSASSDVFVALRARGRSSLGESTVRLCDQCHRPAGEDHLQCVTCHAAVGNRGTKNGEMIWALDGPVRGPYDNVDERAPHTVTKGDFLASADLCGTCHDVDGPGGFKESPFEHWLSSPAARDDVTCASCHFSPSAGDPNAPREIGPLADFPGLEPRPLSSHHPIGLDDADDRAQRLVENGAAVRVVGVGNTVTVEVENSARGHPLPTGGTFLRELWLSVEIADASGVVFRSGFVDGEGRVVSDDRDVRWLSTRLFDRGEETADPYEATQQIDHSIPPEQRRRFVFEPPAGTQAVSVRACLRYRRYRRDLVELLALDRSDPIVDLVCN